MGLLKKLFNWKKKTEDPVFEIEDWNEVVYDRSDLKINDTQQRKEYVKGCLEQIAEASKELEALQFEYNMVTSYLKDMEEIEALPEEEKEGLMVYARKIEELEERQSGYKTRANRMSDVKYHQIERMEEDVQEGYEKLAETREVIDSEIVASASREFTDAYMEYYGAEPNYAEVTKLLLAYYEKM